MERYRIIGSVDNFDGQQNLEEWIQMVGRAADFAGWTEEQTFKAALFRLRGEAGEHVEQLRSEDKIKLERSVFRRQGKSNGTNIY